MKTNDVNIKLNQNLWGLILSLLALGSAEYFKLCTLYWFGLVLSVLAGISFAISMFAYTVRYWKDKFKDG